MGDKRNLSFMENFGLSGAAAIISKTASAPIDDKAGTSGDPLQRSGRLHT